MADELCGVLTSNGMPCNMPKGHSANFHRYRNYKHPLKWVITDAKSKKELESGSGRKELGYAMTYWLTKSLTLLIEVKP